MMSLSERHSPHGRCWVGYGRGGQRQGTGGAQSPFDSAARRSGRHFGGHRAIASCRQMRIDAGARDHLVSRFGRK